MGPANKVKKMIEKEKKKEEMTDVLFLTQLKELMDLEIKQMVERLSATRFNRKHVVSIIEKIGKK